MSVLSASSQIRERLREELVIVGWLKVDNGCDVRAYVLHVQVTFMIVQGLNNLLKKLSEFGALTLKASGGTAIVSAFLSFLSTAKYPHVPTYATFLLRMFLWSNCVLSSEPLKMNADVLSRKSSSSLSGSCSSSILLACFSYCCSYLSDSSAKTLCLGITTRTLSSHSTFDATYCPVLQAVPCACLEHPPLHLSQLPRCLWVVVDHPHLIPRRIPALMISS